MMPDFAMRMIGVFGKREMELAAICIVDYFKAHKGNKKFPKTIFESDYEKRGYELLKRAGLISKIDVPTFQFWEKVDGHCN